MSLLETFLTFLTRPTLGRALEVARALRPCDSALLAACLYAAARSPRQPRPGNIREAATAARLCDPRGFISSTSKALRAELVDADAHLFRVCYRLYFLLRWPTWANAQDLARALGPCSEKAVAATLLAATVRVRC